VEPTRLRTAGALILLCLLPISAVPAETAALASAPALRSERDGVAPPAAEPHQLERIDARVSTAPGGDAPNAGAGR